MGTIRNISHVFENNQDIAAIIAAVNDLLSGKANADAEVLTRGEYRIVTFDFDNYELEIVSDTDGNPTAIYYDSPQTSHELVGRDAVRSALARQNLFGGLAYKIKTAISGEAVR